MGGGVRERKKEREKKIERENDGEKYNGRDR
jgi:hypothetical protein